MTAILLIGVAAFGLFQDAKETRGEEGLRDAWPKLAEAWRALDEVPADPASDEYVKAMARIHGAFEAAGWLDATLDYVPGAMKQLFRLRQTEPTAKSAVARRVVVGAGGGAPPGGVWTPLTHTRGTNVAALTAACRKLRELKEKGLDDEDNVQDAMAVVRGSMKQLGLMADNTPAWLRRRIVSVTRAFLLGEAYPEPAKASEEDERRVKSLLVDLGAGDIEARGTAERDLMRMGEMIAPFLREAAASADGEVASRAKRLLGVGHEPWKNAPDTRHQDCPVDVIRAVPAPARAPDAPAPPK